MIGVENQNDVDMFTELYELFDFDEDSSQNNCDEISSNVTSENYFHFDINNEDNYYNASISTVPEDEILLKLNDDAIYSSVFADNYSYSLMKKPYCRSPNLLPRYKSLNYHSLIEIPYNLERIFGIGNIRNLNNLLQPYCENTCMVHFPEFSLNLNGYKYVTLYLQAILLAKPDIILKLDKTHVNGDLIEAKFYSIATDSAVLNHFIATKYNAENLISTQHNENHNNNNMNDELLFNSRVVSPRANRIFPKLVMKKNNRNEMIKVMKLLNSDEEVLLTGVSHLNFKINTNTSMITDIYIQSYITNVTSKS